ncbi:MAG: hypothetical protein ABGY96_24335 [bacterium]
MGYAMIAIAVIGLVMQMKSAQQAEEAADLEREQAEQTKAAIKTEAANQAANRNLAFYASVQADLAQNAANNVLNYTGGTTKAMLGGKEVVLQRDLATLQANALAGVRTMGYRQQAATSVANMQKTQAYGNMAMIGLRASQNLNATNTASANQTTVT